MKKPCFHALPAVYSLVESALATLANICEDVGELLDSDSLGRPLNVLVGAAGCRESVVLRVGCVVLPLCSRSLPVPFVLRSFVRSYVLFAASMMFD